MRLLFSRESYERRRCPGVLSMTEAGLLAPSGSVARCGLACGSPVRLRRVEPENRGELPPGIPGGSGCTTG